MKISLTDGLTNTTEEIVLTGDELKSFQASIEQANLELAEAIAEQTNKRAALTAKLTALGLDEDDLKALGLG